MNDDERGETRRSFFNPSTRRKWAPLLLLAAGLGAYTAVGPKLPRTHQVVLDFGPEANDVVDVEVSWTRANNVEDAALTTRWHFAPGTVPRRLPFEARLPEGSWDVEVSLDRQSRPTTRWPYRVNLEGAPFWAGDSGRDRPVVIPVREALR
ncbi:MAG: hypothetical protein ABW133_10545 [Polyangiaceae bacterium]